MRAHVKYAGYVARHKWFVFRAGLRTKAPLWRLLIHDYSKLSRAEWGPYVRRFFSGNAGKLDKSADPDDFHRAWTHHWHRNPHHWEHWLTAEREPLRMPEHFVREMVADWMGAGRAITGKWEAAGWYAGNRDRMNLHPETRALADALVAEHGGSA
jgi:hypothetical protein